LHPSYPSPLLPLLSSSLVLPLSFSPSPHPDSPSIQHTNQQRDVC
jgi:hypothetical protein